MCSAGCGCTQYRWCCPCCTLLHCLGRDNSRQPNQTKICLWTIHAISLLCASTRRDTVAQSVGRMCKPLPTSSPAHARESASRTPRTRQRQSEILLDSRLERPPSIPLPHP